LLLTEPLDLGVDLLRDGDAATGRIDVQQNRFNGVGFLIALELIDDRTRLNELAIDIDDLNAIGESKLRPFVTAEGQHNGRQRDGQKHKGSSTKEEPYEHAVSHLSLPSMDGALAIHGSARVRPSCCLWHGTSRPGWHCRRRFRDRNRIPYVRRPPPGLCG